MGEGPRLAHSRGEALTADWIGEAGGIADQEYAVAGDRPCPVSKGADCGDRSAGLRRAELGPKGEHDLAIMGLKPAGKLPHPVVSAEQGHQAMASGHWSFVDLESVVDRDPDPGIRRPLDPPMGYDAIAMGWPGPDRPSEPVADAGAQPIGNGDPSGSQFAGAAQHTRRTAGRGLHRQDRGFLAELNQGMCLQRLRQQCVEVHPPDSEPLATVGRRRKRDNRLNLADQAKLDATKWGRAGGDGPGFEAEFFKERPSDRQEAFPAGLVPGETGAVKDDDPVPEPCRKEGGGGARRPGADDGEVGVERTRHAFTIRVDVRARRNGVLLVTFWPAVVHILVRAMKRLLAAALAAGLLSACAGVTAPGATKSQTPQQSLNSTGTAMSQLRSTRFDLNGTVHVTLPQALVDQLRAKGGAQAGILASDMTVTLKISGAAQKPDQMQATISARLGGLTLNTEVVAVGGKLYYKDPMTSKWQVLKRSVKSTESRTSSGKLSYQTVLDTAKSVTEVSDPSSTLNGVTVEHYKVVPDLVKLLAAITAGHPTTNSAAMTALQTVLQNATVSADLWTGKDDHLVRRLSYDADLTADLSQLAGALTATAPAKAPMFSLPAGSVAHLTAHIVVDLHDFNTQLKLQAPALS